MHRSRSGNSFRSAFQSGITALSPLTPTLSPTGRGRRFAPHPDPLPCGEREKIRPSPRPSPLRGEGEDSPLTPTLSPAGREGMTPDRAGGIVPPNYWPDARVRVCLSAPFKGYVVVYSPFVH